MSITHPRIFLTIVQYPYPANAFFKLAESFTSSVKEGEISFRERMVRLETRCYWVGIPWTTHRRSSMYTSTYWRPPGEAVWDSAVLYDPIAGG